MFKYIFFFFSFFVALSSCSVENVEDQERQKDEADIQNYISQTKLTNMLKTADGMYYSIKPSGATKVAATSDLVKLSYKLYLLDGSLIDSTNASASQFKYVVYDISQNIFNPIIKLMKEGDKGTFLLPSSLAYGSSSFANVPAYSVIRVELEVVSIRTQEEQISDMKIVYGFTNPEKTSSGMIFQKISESPTETAVESGKNISVKYVGRLGYKYMQVDGTSNTLIYDSKFGEGQFSFVVGAGQVIKGFEEAVKKMKKNEKAKVILPYDIAYGTNGNSSSIPGYTSLYFEIEVVFIQ